VTRTLRVWEGDLALRRRARVARRESFGKKEFFTGNPLAWLRRIVLHMKTTIFALLALTTGAAFTGCVVHDEDRRPASGPATRTMSTTSSSTEVHRMSPPASTSTTVISQ
jgi:hypothetical protein